MKRNFTNNIALAVSLTLVFSTTSFAQDMKGETKKSDWEISLGGGVGYQPDYEGSDDYKVTPIPYLQIRWKDRVSLSPGGLEIDALKSENLTLGLGVGMTDSREAGDNDALRGLGDIDTSVSGKLYGSYEWKNLEFGAAFDQDLGSGHEGFLIDLEAKAKFPVIKDKLMVMAGPSATWASDDYMQSFFGISSTQAANSAYSQYDAGSGFKNANFGVGAMYKLTENVNVNFKAEYSKLLGDAADSPIVKDEGSEDQFFTGLFLSYTF